MKGNAINKFRDYYFNFKINDNKVFTVFRDEADWQQKVAIISNYKDKELRNSNFGIFGNTFPKRIEDIFISPLPKKSPKYLEDVIQLSLFQIWYFRKELNDFIKKRDELERFFIEGNINSALDILTKHSEESGFSYWYLDQLALLRSLSADVEPLFLAEIDKLKNKRSFIRMQLYNYLKDKYGEDSALFSLISEFKSTVSKTLKRSIENGKMASFSVLKLLMFPATELQSREELIKGLWASEGLSIIDRFLLVEKCAYFIRSNKIQLRVDIPDSIINDIDSNERILNIFKTFFSKEETYHYLKQELCYFDEIIHEKLTSNSTILYEFSDRIKDFFDKLGEDEIDKEPLLSSIFKYDLLNITVPFSAIYNNILNVKELSISNEIHNDSFVKEESEILLLEKNISQKIEGGDSSNIKTASSLAEKTATAFGLKTAFSTLNKQQNNLPVLNLLNEIYFTKRHLLDLLPLESYLDNLMNSKDKEALQKVTPSLLSHYLEMKNQFGLDFNKIYKFLDYFLFYNGLKLPRDLFDKTFLNEMEMFELLEKVCVPNVIDSLRSINSTSEVIEERLYILLFLMEKLKDKSKSDLQNEFNGLLKEVTLSKEVASVTQGRVFTDKDQIHRILRERVERYTYFFNQLRDEYIDRIITELVNEYNFSLAEEDDTASTGKERSKETELKSEKISVRYFVFEKIYDVIKREFLFHSYFGLDSCLSVRIRHGHFKSFTRSLFSQNNILASGGDDEYVYDKSHLEKQVSSGVISKKEYDQIIKELSLFSSEMGHFVDNVKNKILHIKNNDYPLGVFDFALLDGELMAFYKTLNLNKDVEPSEVFNLIYSFIERQLDKALGHVKDYLKEKFSEEITSRLDKLSKNIKQINKDVNILSDINKCRAEIGTYIDNIISWFQMSSDDIFEDFEINYLVNICKKSTEEVIKGLSFDFKEASSGDSFYLDGKLKRHLVDVIHTIFMNIVRHSGQELCDCKAVVIYNFEKPNITVSFKNQIETNNLSGTENKLSEIRNHLTQNKTSDEMRSEGGTGLIKIYNILKNHVSKDCKIDFEINDNKFCLNLNLKGLNL